MADQIRRLPADVVAARKTIAPVDGVYAPIAAEVFADPADSGWTRVEHARLLPPDEEKVIGRLEAAVAELNTLTLAARGVVAEMRHSAEDGVRAARTETATDRSSPDGPWCWEHDRGVNLCVDAGLFDCPVPATDYADPTGVAAASPDRAEEHLRTFLKAAKAISGATVHMAALATLYPAQAEERPPTPDQDGPDDKHCVNCWLDDKYPQLVTLDPKGKPYYPRRCKKCGEFEAANGFPKPRNLLRLTHMHKRITQGMVDAAIREHKRLHPPKSKTKPKNRKK